MADRNVVHVGRKAMSSYSEGYTAALGDAVAAVFHCLAWEDEQLDADGHPRLYLWQDHALAAINKLRGQP